ncbi:MAG TPA: hypothetical protein VET89_03760 [Stellaceae bacterium]|jgi:hypothetical protein|nr:hypothetical protein [Stellaceae bacterium]
MTYRVEIQRDETVPTGGVTVEITLFTDRTPETNEAGYRRLIRIPRSVWKTRMYFAGDFESLREALDAVEAAYPDIDRIRCYEWSNDDETPVEMAILARSEGKWAPLPSG